MPLNNPGHHKSQPKQKDTCSARGKTREKIPCCAGIANKAEPAKVADTQGTEQRPEQQHRGHLDAPRKVAMKRHSLDLPDQASQHSVHPVPGQ